jgi:tellurite resistance protein
MSDAFKDRERGLEEDYFRRKEQELIEKMRQKQAAESERQQLAEATGIADEAILNDLQELGFTRSTISLLHLVPLAQVAWADGSVSSREREQMMEIARMRGIAEGSDADKQLARLLDKQPSEEFFSQSLRVIRAVMHSLPTDQQENARRDLVAFSICIASASGGILGLGDKVSDEERAMITQIARSLEESRSQAAQKILAN